ncbi:MAG TPA: STAS domain-containing protein [Solirubrobacteraceae bacterium]|jgi:anti-anti-sigma factor|nr:STAS domain-containing protein [Solirubrobacteraceae bacterium]
MTPSADNAALARIEQTVAEDVSLIAVSGEVDISNVKDLREAAYALPNDALGVVVDLTQTRFMDSTTVGLLFDLRANLARRRQALRVVCPDGSIPRRLLEVTCFPADTLVDPDVTAAVASIRLELAQAE